MRVQTLVSLAVCLAALSVSGQTAVRTNTLQPISLQECTRLALLQNRELQIQRYNPEIARLTLSGSYAPYDPVVSMDGRHTHKASPGSYNADIQLPTPGYTAEDYTFQGGLSGDLPIGMAYTLGLNYNNFWGSQTGYPLDSFSAGVAVEVRQHLLKNFWTDQTRTTIQVNKRELKITELGVDYLVMDVITRVETAYYGLIYAREAVKVGEKLLELKRRFYNESRRKVEVGTLPPLDEKLAESQVASVEADLILAHNNVALAENTLKSQLGDDFVSSTGVTLLPTENLVVVPEPFDLAESWRQGLAKRPDLLQLRLDVEKADLNLKYARNQLFPSLDLVAGYGLRGSDNLTSSQPDPSSAGPFGQIRSRSSPNDLLGVIFSVPLSRTAERASYKTSQLRKSQAIVLLKQREEAILKEIDDAVKNAQTSLQRVTATRVATEYARAALEAEDKKLLAGKSTAYVVLQLQSDLASAAIAELQAKVNYNRTLAQLRFVEGTALERNKIQIELK